MKSSKTIKSVLKYIAIGGITTVATYFLIDAIAVSYNEQILSDLSINYGLLFASIVLLVSGYLLLAYNWREVLLSTEQNVSFTGGLMAWCLSQFGKYIPGKVWMIFGRAQMLKAENVPQKNTLVSIAFESVLMNVAALFLGSVLMIQYLRQVDNYFLYVLIVIGALILLHPRVIRYALTLAGRFFKTDLNVIVRYKEIYLLLLNYFVAWAFIGLGFAVLLRALSIADIGIFTAMGLFMISWSIGFLSIVAPGGIGVREAVMVAVMSLQIDISLAVIVTVVARLWWISAEVLSLGLVYGMRVVRKILKSGKVDNIGGNFFNKYESKNPIEKMFMEMYYARLSKFIKKTNAKSLLDVGCGEGHITQRIKDQFKLDIHGRDLEKEVIDLARKEHPGIDFQMGSIYQLKEADASYDIVFAGEVIEHLYEPDKAIAELKRVARQFVIVSVPNEPLWRLGNMARLKYWKQLGNTPGHVQNFSTKEIRNQLLRYFPSVTARRAGMWTFVLCSKKVTAFS